MPMFHRTHKGCHVKSSRKSISFIWGLAFIMFWRNVNTGTLYHIQKLNSDQRKFRNQKLFIHPEPRHSVNALLHPETEIFNNWKIIKEWTNFFIFFSNCDIFQAYREGLKKKTEQRPSMYSSSRVHQYRIYSIYHILLENSTDRGAWQATVSVFTKSRTWLSD